MHHESVQIPAARVDHEPQQHTPGKVQTLLHSFDAGKQGRLAMLLISIS